MRHVDCPFGAFCDSNAVIGIAASVYAKGTTGSVAWLSASIAVSTAAASVCTAESVRATSWDARPDVASPDEFAIRRPEQHHA